MKRLMICFATAALVTGTCFAVNNNAGTSTAQFLKLGAGARPSGMGEAYAGVVNDASAIYWNPAGLSNIDGGSLSVMHAMWFGDIDYEWASYARSAGRAGVFGAGVQYLSYGSIKKLDTTGLEGDTLTPSDLAAYVSYARNMGIFGLGVNLKYISTTIENTATAFAIDLGAQRTVGTDLKLGLVVQNIGSKMKFVSEEDPLPLNIKLGGAYTINGNWMAALDVNKPNDDDLLFGVGTEYLISLGSKAGAAARLGYTTIAKDTGGQNSVTAGLGLRYEVYMIDYAYVPYGDLGNTQRISLSVQFK